MNTFPINSAVRLQVTFKLANDGSALAPTAVNLFVKDPKGTETKYTGNQLTNTSTGVYQADVIPAVAGTWVYRWEGTGNVRVDSIDRYFNVAASQLSDI